MTSTLYLLPEERAAFEVLPLARQHATMYTILDEDPTHLETPEQGMFRLRILTDTSSPRIKQLAAQLDAIDPAALSQASISMSAITRDDVALLSSAMGARGMSALITAGREHCDTTADLRAIARLTIIRHGLLQSNADFFRSSRS